MGKVTAVGQVHAHYCIARLKKGKLDCHVSLCSGVGLNIHVSAAEKLFSPFPCQLLCNIYTLAAAVVPLSWVAFGILVGHDTAISLKDSVGNVVLGSDKLDIMVLSGFLLLDCSPDFRVCIFQMVIKKSHEFLPVIVFFYLIWKPSNSK